MHVSALPGSLREGPDGAVQFARRTIDQQVVEAVAAGRIESRENGVYGRTPFIVIVRRKITSAQGFKQNPGQSSKAQYKQEKIFKCHRIQVFNVIASELYIKFLLICPLLGCLIIKISSRENKAIKYYTHYQQKTGQNVSHFARSPVFLP